MQLTLTVKLITQTGRSTNSRIVALHVYFKYYYAVPSTVYNHLRILSTQSEILLRWRGGGDWRRSPGR